MHGVRRFIDRVGFSWQVCELGAPLAAPTSLAAPAFDAGGREPGAGTTPGWLYFLSRGTTLVLRDYPSTWDELSWRELEALRERAVLLGSDTPMRVAAGR